MNMKVVRSNSNWFYCARPNPRAGLKLFCFPYAGGAARIYRDWPDNLPFGVEVQAVQLPGRGARMTEPPFTSLPSLIEDVSDAIRPLLDRPFAFFGHSMGALIAFELARQLRRERGAEPAHLFVSGRRASHLTRTEPPTYNLPDDEFVKELARLNGTSREILEHPELMSLMIPPLRADFAVSQCYSYVPEPPLSCPLTAFGGLGEKHLTREDIEAWREHTTGAFKVRMLPGDHFFLHTSRSLLLRILSRELSGLLKGIVEG
jgi:medium-chain acyl-[acyl-carrier-protein] hydrolase